MKKHTTKEVKSGKWKYDNCKFMTVKIFELNYDYWYEIAKADDRLEKNECPNLNSEGVSYMIKWGEGEFADEDLVTKDWGGLDIVTAMNQAESKVQGGIIWNE